MLKYDYWLWDNAISKEDCEYFLKDLTWQDSQPGLFFLNEEKGFVQNDEKRITDTVWLNPSSLIGCVINSYIRNANKFAGWNFDLADIENIQIGRYQKTGHYVWHRDASFPDTNGIQRKLSCSVLLNDSSEFEGGNLEFHGMEKQPVLKQGSLIVFPSFIEHRVVPVTSGTRYSAVSWVNGPAFK
jgi:PKHD-type hydroxylase